MTHGPGNRPCSSVIPRNAYFYAVSAPSLPHDTTGIDCHKLSDKLSACASTKHFGEGAWDRCAGPLRVA